jgi:hypothetical protein
MANLFTAEDIQAKLSAVIGDQIGTYKTPSGDQPAIRIFTKKLPSEWSIIGTGLEVVIPKNPKRVEIAKNVRHEIFWNQWNVKIVLHKQDFEVGSLLDCLKQRLGHDRLRCQYMQIEGSDMSSEQWVVTIEQMASVLTS